MMNIADGDIITDDLQYVDIDDTILKKYILHYGDILFNRTNSHDLVGKTSLFGLGESFVFASYLIRVVPDTSQLVPEYLNYYLNWDTSQISPSK